MQSMEAVHIQDVPVEEVWAHLEEDPGSVLIDVRTRAEWTYVGVPLLSSIGKATVFVEWDDFATGGLVPDFVGRLKAELGRLGVADDAPLHFICRSGSRSRQAAVMATAAGYSKAFNVASGFEGRLDAERHRATKGSWKGEGLPWVQS